MLHVKQEDENTHIGSLETIPADMEVSPSLMVTTGPPVFSTPTTSSRTISPMKNGVAFMHIWRKKSITDTDIQSWLSTVERYENTTVSSPLLPLAVVSSTSICFGGRAKSSQDFHVLWSMMFVSLYEAGAAGLKPQSFGRLENINIYLNGAAPKCSFFSFFLETMSHGNQAK